MTHNGRMKGRDAPAETLYDFVFQGTGRQVQIRKLSALIRDEVRRQVRRDPAFPEPEPPLVEVDYGNGKIAQPHRAHPIYLELHAAWERRVQTEASDRLTIVAIQRAVVCEIDHAAVAQIRADMAAIRTPLDAYDDHYVYVAFVCVGPYDDWTDLLKAVFERAGPAEAAIQAHIDSFRGDAERKTALAPEPRSAE